MYFLINLCVCSIGYIVFSKEDIKNRIMGVKRTGLGRPGKKTIAVMCFTVYIVCSYIFYKFLGEIVPGIILAVLPSILPYVVNDIISRFREDRETRQITFFLLTMAKWSGVKNDLIYCLKKADETKLRNPMGKMIKTTLGRIYSGMDSVTALALLEDEVYGEELRYLVKNIKFSAEKGGNLQKLFKGMEEQYFKIDEELFKRRISTLRDRMTVYMTIFVVIAMGILFIGKNPAVRQFYIGTSQGNMLLALFILLFIAAVLLILRK